MLVEVEAVGVLGRTDEWARKAARKLERKGRFEVIMLCVVGGDVCLDACVDLRILARGKANSHFRAAGRTRRLLCYG